MGSGSKRVVERWGRMIKCCYRNASCEDPSFFLFAPGRLEVMRLPAPVLCPETLDCPGALLELCSNPQTPMERRSQERECMLRLLLSELIHGRLFPFAGLPMTV